MRKYKVKPARFAILANIIRNMAINRIFEYKRTYCIIKPVFFYRKINPEVPLGFGTALSLQPNWNETRTSGIRYLNFRFLDIIFIF